MQSRLRHYASRTCRAVTDALQVAFGGVPRTLTFGTAGEEGVSNLVARADHRHALEDPPTDTFDDFDTNAFLVDDFMYTASGNIPYADTNFVDLGGFDDTSGALGAWGSVSYGSALSGRNCGLVVQARVAAVSVTPQLHTMARPNLMECRLRPARTTSQLALLRCCVGYARFSSNDIDPANYQGGVMMHLETDASSQGTWQAYANTVDGTQIVDTGVGPFTSGSDVEFQTLRMQRGGGGWAFLINNSEVARIDTDNTTDATDTAGFIVMMRTLSALDRQMDVDYLLWRGLRQEDD